MKSILTIFLAILIAFGIPIATEATNSWPIKNGTIQLTNFKDTSFSNEMFLKHELALSTIGSPSQMLIQDDTLYTISANNSKVYSVSLDTKAILWEFTPPNEKDIRKIALVNGHIAVLTYDQLYFLEDQGNDKTLVWTSEAGGNEISFDSEKIYTYDATSIKATNWQTGEMNWTYKFSSSWEKFHSPISNNGKLYFTTNNQMEMATKLYCMNKQTGQALWTSNVDYYAQYPLVLGDKIILSSHTEAFAYHADTGVYQWRRPLGSTYASTFGHTFSANHETIFTRTHSGLLLGLNPSNGAVKFQTDFRTTVSGSLTPFTKGPILVTNNQVVLENAGRLKFYNSTTGTHEHTIAFPNQKLVPLALTMQYLLATDNEKLYVFAEPLDEQYVDPDGNVVPEEPPAPNPQEEQTIYVVKSGDSLWKIAQQFSTTVQQIVELNNLNQDDFIWVGQNLTVPKPKKIHIVQAGDALWKIAQQYGTTIQAIVEANNLDPNAHIWVGQRIIIPEQVKVHTVQTGDTLWKIAQSYGTTIQAIVEKNNLDPSAYIWVGQKISIP